MIEGIIEIIERQNKVIEIYSLFLYPSVILTLLVRTSFKILEDCEQILEGYLIDWVKICR